MEDGMLLQECPKEFLKDREVIISAVSNNGLAIQFINKIQL